MQRRRAKALNMKKTSLILLLLLSAVLRPAAAQQPMTLHDCMEYALSHATKLRIRQAETGDARIARRDALLAVFLPNINGSTSAYYNFGRNIDPETNTYINTVSFNNGYSLSASITLFNGFSAVNNLKISQTSLKMGKTRELQAEADICLAVMEAYYNVLYYQKLLEIYESQVATAEQLVQKVRRQEELGQKGHADVVQLEADLADRRYDLVNTRNLLADHRVNLEDLLFWPADEPLVIDDGVTALVPQPATGDSGLVDYALAHNPAVRLAAWTVENARLELNTAKWQILPSVSLSSGWSTSYYSYQGNQTTPYFDMLRSNAGEYIAMSVSIPIFNRLSRQSNIARRRNALVRATAEYDQKQRDVESEVRRAVQDRDGAEAAYEQAERKAEVQQEAYALNTRKMEQGLISPLEYQTAANNYLRAGADRLNSLFKFLIKQSIVRYYGGEEYINQ